MRTLGRGVLAVGKALLTQVAVVGFWLALGLVLSLVFGVTGRFDRWVRTHNISPSLLVAIAVFLTVCAQQGAREQKAQQMQRPPDERGPGPPHRAGGPARSATRPTRGLDMLRKLRAAIQPPAPAGSGSPAGQPTAVMLSGGLEVGVVGESHYQDALTAIVGGKGPESVRIPTQATLVPEPDNPYDPNAVAVYIAGRKVGHLPRPAAQAFAPVGRRLAEQRQVGACSATITGGWDRGDGDTGHFGITLDLAHPDQLL